MNKTVRVFLWKVCHDAILSNKNMIKRQIATFAAYNQCDVVTETTLHILHDCPKAKEVWESLLIRETRNIFSLFL